MIGFFLLHLTGCGFVYDEKLVGPYRLVAIDITEQMSVCYSAAAEESCIGRIEETVFSVGWNAQYIVAKQHPSNDKSVTNYFILDIAKDRMNSDPSESVTGPLSEVEFKMQSASRRLPAFTKTIHELE